MEILERGLFEEGIPPGVVNVTLTHFNSGHNQNCNCDHCSTGTIAFTITTFLCSALHYRDDFPVDLQQWYHLPFWRLFSRFRGIVFYSGYTLPVIWVTLVVAVPHIPHEIFWDISGKISTVLITSRLILVKFPELSQ